MKPSRLAVVPLLVLLGLLVFAGRAAAQAQATLRPGDAVRVEIWREGDLSGEFAVALDGTVTLPLLGRQRLVDVPLAMLRDTLTAQYRVHLRNPSINITPLRRVHVLGSVRQPGVYPVDPTVTLADAVALAGGTTEGGDLRRIRIVRRGEVIRERVAAGETLREVDLNSGDQIYVEQRPWIQRNGATLVGMAISATNLALNLIRIRRAGS